eukprot:scaffold2723_cov108-Isochrysis_galbana.AAC.7
MWITPFRWYENPAVAQTHGQSSGIQAKRGRGRATLEAELCAAIHPAATARAAATHPAPECCALESCLGLGRLGCPHHVPSRRWAAAYVPARRAPGGQQRGAERGRFVPQFTIPLIGLRLQPLLLGDEPI